MSTKIVFAKIWSVDAKQYRKDSQSHLRGTMNPVGTGLRMALEMAAFEDRSALQSNRKSMVWHLLRKPASRTMSQIEIHNMYPCCSRVWCRSGSLELNLHDCERDMYHLSFTRSADCISCTIFVKDIVEKSTSILWKHYFLLHSIILYLLVNKFW